MPIDRRETPREPTHAQGQLIFEGCPVLPYFVPVQLINTSESGVLLSTDELVEVGRRTELCVGFGPRRWVQVRRLVDTGAHDVGRFQIAATILPSGHRTKTRARIAALRDRWSRPERPWSRLAHWIGAAS